MRHLTCTDPEAVRDYEMVSFGNVPPPPAGESEDCLYLNVYAPAAPGAGRTVMFWIYGGNLQFGSNSVAFYDGTAFAAEQGVVLVVPNYRTNGNVYETDATVRLMLTGPTAFGFPMAPQLPLTERNLGFLDQRLALDWVQRNIAAFGGDPKKVTIFGESAGAASVNGLVTSMRHNPPFRAAIMESPPTFLYNNLNNSNTAPWDFLAAALNCSGSAAKILQCVKAADALTIQSIEEHAALFFGPVSDNVTQLEFSEQARLAGNIARVPILTGTNANEGRSLVVGMNNTVAYLRATFSSLPALQKAVLAAYPQGSPGLETAFDVIAAIDTDFTFRCTSGITANDSNAAGIPTWRYYFNATFSNTQLFPGSGVYHYSEVPIVFGTYPGANATAEEGNLSNFIQTAWATFAKNPMGGPSWKGWPYMGVLGTPGGPLVANVLAGALDAKCALYAPYYATLGVSKKHYG